MMVAIRLLLALLLRSRDNAGVGMQIVVTPPDAREPANEAASLFD
jgi:hypothetical protein